MEDPRWLRLIAVGLVLAVLVVGYSLLTGSFIKSKTITNSTQVAKTATLPSPVPFTPPTVVPNVIDKESTSSAYDRIAQRNQSNIHTLPKTSFPTGLILAVSLIAIVSGLRIRRFSD